MTPEEEIKYYEDKIAELKKQINACDIKEGELCYFWDGDERPSKPQTEYFGKYIYGYNKPFETCDGSLWKHCEPVIKKYGLKLWVARDKDNSLYVFTLKPNKYEIFWRNGVYDEPFMRIPSELFPNVKWEDDEPTLIEV